MIQFACPGCAAVFAVGDEKGGKTGKCPNCGAQFQIPMPQASAPPPVPPPPKPTLTPLSPPPLPPPAGAVELSCPSCRGALAVHAADLEAVVECPFCKTQFRAAKPGESPPTSRSGSKSSLHDVLGPVSGGERRSRRGRREDDDERPSRRDRARDDDEDERPSRRSRSRDDEDDRPSRRRRRGGDEPELKGGQGLGIGSMVCGILALAIELPSLATNLFGLGCCFCVPFSWLGHALAVILGLVGLGLGVFALKTPGRGMAIAGVSCSGAALLGAVVGVVLTIFGFAVFAAAANAPQQNNNAWPPPNNNNPPFNRR